MVCCCRAAGVNYARFGLLFLRWVGCGCLSTSGAAVGVESGDFAARWLVGYWSEMGLLWEAVATGLWWVGDVLRVRITQDVGRCSVVG